MCWALVYYLYVLLYFQSVDINIGHYIQDNVHVCDCILTAASLSKRAKSSLRVITNSCAVHCDARLVKPSMSANKMLQKHKDKRNSIQHSSFSQFGTPNSLRTAVLVSANCFPNDAADGHGLPL